MGFYIAASIILGIVGGHWLDNKFNASPVWLIIGLILGIAAAVFGTYNMLKPFLEGNGKNKDKK